MEEHFPSTDDKRILNNVLRHEYRTLTAEEKDKMKRIKDIGMEFLIAVNDLGATREVSLAKTKIEEAVFWAVKHITR